MAKPVIKPEVKIFSEDDLLISQQSRRRPYAPRGRIGDFGSVPHWGQRKLLLSEIEFFNNHWNPKLIPNPICVYAGAAKGTHITLLAKMFPAFTFYLYDPSAFSIQETDKIKIFTGEVKGYFTDAVAETYARRNDVFFISDIRTADWKKNFEDALRKQGITEFDRDGRPIGDAKLIEAAEKEYKPKIENEVWGDMERQQRWVQIINPEHALLKFRLPWPDKEGDRLVKYLNGLIYWQQWVGYTSTETRLKPIRNDSGTYDLVDYSILIYEQQCAYHNVVTRETIHYKNIFTGTDDPIDFPELLNDWDSMAEAMILKQYFQNQGTKNSDQLYTRSKQLSRLITSVLNFDDMKRETVTTLCILRASPFKASNTRITAQRNAWFRDHPEERTKCIAQYEGVEPSPTKPGPKPMAPTKPIYTSKPERRKPETRPINPSEEKKTIQSKVPQTRPKPETTLRAQATEFTPPASPADYKLPTMPSYVKLITNPRYVPIKIQSVPPISVPPL